MKKRKDMKPLLTIAGPGAGKTYSMVNEIISKLPSLQPHRYIAVITYTHAATQELIERIAKKTIIPPNLFIGTIHSFLIKFILDPFGMIKGGLPERRVYTEVEFELTAKDAKGKRIEEARKKKHIIEKGIIPYESIVSKSKELISTDRAIRSIVANRLQVLFIDEYQDTNIQQHEIFEQIGKEKKTEIYCVGDPEQYIMGFTYKGQKKPDYEKIPFNRLKAHIKKKNENHRSGVKIVNFINHFNCYLQQEPACEESYQGEVCFLLANDLNSIIGTFQKICEQDKCLCKEAITIRYYLAKEKKIYQKLAGKYNIAVGPREKQNDKSKFSEVIHCICSVVHKSKHDILKHHNLDEFEFRRKCLKIFVVLVKNKNIKCTKLAEIICRLFEYQITELASNHEKLLQELKDKFVCDGEQTCTNDYYMTIHKAKGLQADAILVVAKTNNELKKWLVEEKDSRYNDKNDDCRLGYVAFSRAKKLLCIACQQPIEDEIAEKLKKFKVEFI